MSHRRENTFERGPALNKIERILKLLECESLTPPEIAEKLHMSQANVVIYLKHLKATDEVHIMGWTRKPVCGQRPFPRPKYRIGPGADVRKIAPLPKNEVAKRLRKKVKRDPDAVPGTVMKMRRNRERQRLKAQTERLKKMKQLGYLTAGFTDVMTTGKVMLGEKRRSPTPVQIAEIIRLREEGVYWKSISAQLGIPVTTAHSIYKRLTGNTC